MKINWKVRLRSYPFWVAVFGFIGFIVADSGVLEIGHPSRTDERLCFLAS